MFQKIRQIFQAEDEMDDGMKKEAAALIRNIFRYMDKDAKDIMTHRKNIVAIDGEETLEGAMFFYAPALSPGTWINENRTYLTTIGCHRFYL